MTDYGHELRFGVFPTPSAGSEHALLELAQLADVRGLDLLSVQDHPYQARHLDAWTLLAVVGARTSQLTVATNVANLPLRPPVVLARSVATLDRLTGGRVELGLGAGAFWDAVVAAGGERRTPGEAVAALAEAIAVVRGVWRGSGTVRLDGEHYRVHGLHSGPAPAHPVPIWVGAYGPRMLRLTGRLADAWIPSMGYTTLEDLPAMNAQVDEAAEAAGRAPADVRRMYNISGRFGTGAGFLQGRPREWAEQLAALALDEGFSDYVLGTDDPDDVRRFADEVAPAVRELVAAERELVAAGVEPVQEAPARTDVPHPHATAPATPLAVVPTPDDGTRLTDGPGRDTWDESTRPSVTRDPATPYTPEQQAAAQHLVDVHDALRSELAQLRDVVGQVRRGLLDAGAARSALNAMTLRQNSWTLGAYCASYCRIVTGHHTLEDRSIFPHLRAADPELGPVVDRLEQEHHVIAGVLEEVDRALVALVEGPGRLGGLEHAIDLLTDTLLSHLAYEERELSHPLAAHGFY
ncbi:MAG TPA: LLM class flavin-dependent oxidoreductase [Marmoricola sp.]|nr:LLM class flavin-dependent oxidoreductase [Marmoricola sp.]